MLKFFEGDKKAKIWQEKYGSVYRIWSGFSPEVYVSSCRSLETLKKLLILMQCPHSLRSDPNSLSRFEYAC